MNTAPVILVTGCNRGLGLEFVKQYAELGWEVIATAREPQHAPELSALAAQHRKVTIEALDVGDPYAITELAGRYVGKSIDVLLNNAGLLGDRNTQAFKHLDFNSFEEIMRVNAYGPLAIARAFLPNILAGQQKKIIGITSGLSSITNTSQFGNLYFYRMSKTALNMGLRVLQVELREVGVKVGILAPGMVNTRLLRSSGYQGSGVLQVSQSVAAVIKNIERLSQSAEIILYTGETVPW